MHKPAAVAYLLLVIFLGSLLGGLWFVVDDVRAGEVLHFESPWALCLIAGAALVAAVGFHGRSRWRASFWFSSGTVLSDTRPGWVARLARLPAVLRVVALTLIAFALARPQTFSRSETTVEGIDIMFVLDLSKSMEEEDLKRNRLDAGQRTIREFLHERKGKGDRIGLVVFAKEAMLQCPLTLDYKSLEAVVADLQIGDVAPLGTAVGDALGLALASLRRSSSASKVIILISDGDWNKARYMDPMEATALGVEMGVRIFSVLMGQETSGRQGGGRVRAQYAVNPEVLKAIAEDTGGTYFNAADDGQLSESFAEIRKSLATSENIQIGSSPHLELFDYLLWPAMLLLLLELLLRMTRFRSFP